MRYELDRREISRKLRERLFATSFLLLCALGFAWAVLDDGWLYGHRGSLRHTLAEVTDLQREDGAERWLAGFAFEGVDGSSRRAEARFDEPPDFEVGDRIRFVHSLDGRPTARPQTPDERVVMTVLRWLTLATWLVCLVVLAMVLRPYLRRRRLLDHGIPEVLGAARVETREYSLIGPPQQLWRLCAGQFDASLPGWRDYCSDWQASAPPVLDEATPLPPLLRDPGDSARYWLPVASWAAERRGGA